MWWQTLYCTSIATISRRGVKEKLYFPGGLLTWRGVVVLRTPRRLIWAILVPRPLEDIFSSPPLSCQSTWPHTPRLRGTAHAHLFFYIVVSRPRLRDICTSIAHISLRGVRRTTSPRQVSNPPGKYNISSYLPLCCAIQPPVNDILSCLIWNRLSLSCERIVSHSTKKFVQ